MKNFTHITRYGMRVEFTVVGNNTYKVFHPESYFTRTGLDENMDYEFIDFEGGPMIRRGLPLPGNEYYKVVSIHNDGAWFVVVEEV